MSEMSFLTRYFPTSLRVVRMVLFMGFEMCDP